MGISKADGLQPALASDRLAPDELDDEEDWVIAEAVFKRLHLA